VLERNPRAARGSAYLDSIELEQAKDLADALRGFETGASDVGWLGAGLHRRREGATDFRSPALGFILLRTGKSAGTWGAPGVAQRLADAVPRRQLVHLGLTEEGSGEAIRWGTAPAALMVDSTSPHLVAIAQAVASAIGQPRHQVNVAAVDAQEIRKARQSKDFALMIDFVRLLGNTDELALRSILAAEDPALAVRPPNLRGADARRVARTLRLGVVGKFAVTGAYAPTIAGIEAWRLGDVYAKPTT
jgi:peptide/nickel transport system substrate-binding protein